ncbi:hypothetical protein FDH02_gp28 [Pseudomonas phage VSW-3]|uniref:Holin n=1 Tax=Pseudomonas phage VSW-3 TaxID=1852562 RepID=A0A173GCM1_9CAUD|nr:hypothetical protein FDH02_gp28 [Pseudomonas phage VSW-3]ANH51104.1 hypothetical protein VSW3_28 [Pseudomonas phage VSW-3]
MDSNSRAMTIFASAQGAAVGLYNGLIDVLPALILLMSAALTALQLYVFIRDKFINKEK